jgi:hypothetical protein
MAYNENLAKRIHAAIEGQPGFNAKKMFGGVCYLINGNMACGVVDTRMIVRSGPEGYLDDLNRPHTRPFDYTGKPMRGWLMVDIEGLDTPDALQYWVDRALAYASRLPPK